jgi:hypothetical protein
LLPRNCCSNGIITDDFENIAEEYRLQFEYKVPGGLKAIMATAFGRSLAK